MSENKVYRACPFRFYGFKSYHYLICIKDQWEGIK